MRTFFRSYTSLMIRSRSISIAVCLWMLLLAAYDLVFTWNAITLAENLAVDIARRAMMMIGLVALPFLVRLVLILKINSVPYAFVSLSWAACFAASVAMFEYEFGPDFHPYYIVQPSRLAFWCGIFVVLSAFRFLITAGKASLDNADDISSYS